MADTEAEREMSRTEVADYLRTFADELDTNTPTQTEHQSETSDAPEGEEQQRDETRSTSDSASEEESSDESGVLDSLADDDHENEAGDDQRNHSDRDRDRSDDSEQSPRKVTFMVGNDSTTINPPETVAFEMAVDSESSIFGAETGRTARFALHWDEENVSEDDEFAIQ
jgi:type IV secretory pathway VirB10-like protein